MVAWFYGKDLGGGLIGVSVNVRIHNCLHSTLTMQTSTMSVFFIVSCCLPVFFFARKVVLAR